MNTLPELGYALQRKPYTPPKPRRRADMAVVRAMLARPVPTWSVCQAIGVELSREMEPECGLRELAAELGTTHQQAYHESCVALGKLAWHFWRRVRCPAEAA